MRFLYSLWRTILNGKSPLLPVYNVATQKKCFSKRVIAVAIIGALILPQITLAATAIWTGTAATGSKKDWNNKLNWSTGIIPTASTDVTIPLTALNYPTVPSGLATLKAFLAVRNLTILATSGTVLTIPTGFTLEITGSMTTAGALIDASFGTIDFEGSAPQSISGSYLVSSTVNNLSNANSDPSTGVSISNTLNITGSLVLSNNSILTTNNNLVLISTPTTTAVVTALDQDPFTGVALEAIVGNVTVQRYYRAHRRWRLVTAPVQSSGAPTINAAWQEGGQSIAGSPSDPNPGFGTDISGPTTGSFVSSTGYDQSANNSASIAWLAGPTTWHSIPNTISTPVTAYQGYMLFVRGDRSFPIYTGTASTLATSTILRTTGQLNTGEITVPINTGFNVIGNPYAATINFAGIYAASTGLTNNSFSLWDPNIGSADNLSTSGTGGWVQITDDGTGTGTYIAAVPPTTFDEFDTNGDIQSGAAFTVDGSGSGSVVIDEFDKISDETDGDPYLFRPVVNTNTTIKVSTLRTALYSADTANLYLADGALNIFSSNFTNDVNWNKDVKKQFGLNEKLFILKNGQNIAIEKSALPQAGDTVHLSIGSLKAAPYKLVIATKNFTRPDIKAFLIDSFTNTSTPILLGDTSVTVNFAVTAAPASYTANRFSVVFTAAPIVPVTTTTQTSSIKVYPNPVTNGTANVDLSGLTAGNYTIRVISETGKVVLDETTYHGLSDGLIPLSLGKNVSAGIYIIQIIDPTGNKTKINIEKQ